MTNAWVVKRQMYCSCGYLAEAILANSNEAERAGFKTSAKIKCPCCGRIIYF